MSRLAKFLKDSLDGIESKHFWIDSQTVLTWIRSASADFRPLVSARIQEIQYTYPSFMDEFRYVPSSTNAADALTKPLPEHELSSWHKGPQFLLHREYMWPQDSFKHDSQVEVETRIEGRLEKERMPRRRRVHHVCASMPPCTSCTCLDAAVCIMYVPRRRRGHHVRASTPPWASCTCIDATVCITYVPRRRRMRHVRASTPPCAPCTCLDAAVCIMYVPRRRRVHHVRASTPPCASCTCLDAVVRAADARATDMTIEEKLVTEVSDWDRLTRHVARWRRILQPKTDRPTARAIGAEELKYAQRALFLLCQTQFRERIVQHLSTLPQYLMPRE